MATSTVCKTQDRAFKRALMIMQRNAGASGINSEVGAATANRIKRRIWQCAGAPSSTAPTGMVSGDWILDTTNDDVYWFISGTDYIQLNQIT